MSQQGVLHGFRVILKSLWQVRDETPINISCYMFYFITAHMEKCFFSTSVLEVRYLSFVGRIPLERACGCFELTKS